MVCSCFSFKKYIVFVYVCIYARRRWECIGLKSDLNLIQNRRPFLPHFRCRFQSRHPSFRRWVERGNHQRIRGNLPSRKWMGSFTHPIRCFILLNFLYIEPILKGPLLFYLVLHHKDKEKWYSTLKVIRKCKTHYPDNYQHVEGHSHYNEARIVYNTLSAASTSCFLGVALFHELQRKIV